MTESVKGQFSSVIQDRKPHLLPQVHLKVWMIGPNKDESKLLFFYDDEDLLKLVMTLTWKINVFSCFILFLRGQCVPTWKSNLQKQDPGKLFFVLIPHPSCITSVLLRVSFSSPANLQQRLLGFMRPDGANSQQVQQELQRKYHSELWVQVSTFSWILSWESISQTSLILWILFNNVDLNLVSLCFYLCLQPRLKSMRKCPCRVYSSWCIAPIRLWPYGSFSVIISSA